MGNNILKTSTEDIETTSMQEATFDLADNLTHSEPFVQFLTASKKLNSDPEAIQLLKDISELQQKVRKNQHSGTVTESDLKRLRDLQTAIGLNDTIQAFELSQELAVSFLKEVNQEISSLLGIDFASLARKSGGCC